MFQKFQKAAMLQFASQRYKFRILKELSACGFTPKGLEIGFTQSDTPLFDKRIERRNGGYQLVLSQDCNLSYIRAILKKSAAYIYWLSLASEDIHSITVNGSDGERYSHARFAPSSRTKEQIPFADPHFFLNHGFQSARQSGEHAPAWSSRGDTITWRGGINGNGWLTYTLHDIDSPALLQRTRMVMQLKDHAGCDIRFVRQRGLELTFKADCERAGGFGTPISQDFWLNQKCAIDIDGYANTWSNLLVRMLFGCCVLKVGSQFGYRQWYYDALKPWEHYVPVAADLSDLKDKIEWVRTHNQEASQIALRGQQLARSLTFDSQARVSANLIEEFAR